MIKHFDDLGNKNNLNLRLWYSFFGHIKDCQVKNGLLKMLPNGLF